MNKMNLESYEYEHSYGGMSRQAYNDDPKRLAFTAARYKHVAKLLEGYGRVLEVGCSDGYFSRIVRQHVGELVAVDPDPVAIDEAQQGKSERWPIDFRVGRSEELFNPDSFSAVYSLDVLEHIPPEEERYFLSHVAQIAPVAIYGTPSLESQIYASHLSKARHINCKSGETLKSTLKRHYGHVFMFSMNDEALGTGFLPMSHYLLALCVR